MVFEKKGTTTLVSTENMDITSFMKNLEAAYENVKEDNLIIDLLSFSELTAEEVLDFMVLSNKHIAIKKSFVLVSDKIEYDDIPEALIVVPTLQEAQDLIEMEEIERDLGF